MSGFIETLGSKNKGITAESVEIVNYVDPDRRKSRKFQKQRDDVKNDDDDDDENREKFAEKKKQENVMRKYKHEVMKLGMTGFEKNQARKAKIALAISLGAQPPKNRRKNYKRVIQESKREKRKEAKSKEFATGFTSLQLQKFKTDMKNNKRNKSNKKSNGILGVYGKVTKQSKSK